MSSVLNPMPPSAGTPSSGKPDSAIQNMVATVLASQTQATPAKVRAEPRANINSRIGNSQPASGMSQRPPIASSESAVPAASQR